MGHLDRSGVYSLFRRHTVNIGAMQVATDASGKSIEQYFSLSGFLLSIEGTWYFVTAGHWMQQINEAKKSGVKFVEWHMDDSGAPGASHRQPFPFDFDGADGAGLHHPDGYDYMVLFVRDLYVRNLTADGKSPLSEVYWMLPEPQAGDEFYIVGTPAETLDAVGPTRTKHAYGVARSARMAGFSRPNGLTWQECRYLRSKRACFSYDRTNGDYVVNKSVALVEATLTTRYPSSVDLPFPRLIGRIAGNLVDEETGITVESIVGMSGSPLFAFRPDADGGEYWLIGVQSTWLRDHRLVTACPINILIDWIKEQRAELRQNVGDSPPDSECKRPKPMGADPSPRTSR